jgi:nitrile hydratase
VTFETESKRLPVALRTEALESILLERELVDPTVMDTYIRMDESDIGPLNGAKVVAHAWVDPEYKARLLEEGTSAVAELGFK